MPAMERLVPDDFKIESVEFTPSKIRAAIKKLKADGASGPDDFPPIMFKRTADCIAELLSLVFSSFMSVGKTPVARSNHSGLYRWTHF